MIKFSMPDDDYRVLVASSADVHNHMMYLYVCPNCNARGHSMCVTPTVDWCELGVTSAWHRANIRFGPTMTTANSLCSSVFF